MVGRRGELRVLAARQVVAVGVVDARARAVRATAGSSRRTARPSPCTPRPARTSQPAPRQDAEVARRDRHRPLDVLARAGDELVLGLRACSPGRRRAPRGRRPCRRRSPAARAIVAPLGLDRLELVEADPVDLLGVEVERRPAADRRPVELLAVRAPTRARAPRGVAREVVAAERVEERRVGRVDDVADDVADPLAVRLGRDLDHRRDDRRLDRDREHPLDLGDRPLGDDARARSGPIARPSRRMLDVGGHERRVGVQPGDERLEPLGRVGRLELGQLRAGAAAGRPSGRRPGAGGGAGRPPRSASSAMTWSMSRVIRSSVGRPSVGDRRGLGGGPLHQRRGAAPGPRARVLEPVGVALVAVERGGRRVQLEDRLPEAVGEVVDGRGRDRARSRWVSCCGRGGVAPRRRCGR